MNSSSDCLNVAIQTFFPLAFKKNGENQYNGISIDWIDTILGETNECWRFIPYNGAIGSKSENGSFDGMIGELQKQKFDIVSSPLSITYERYQSVDFTVPFIFLYHAVGYGYPAKADDLLGFVKPLSWTVWIGILISLALVIVALKFDFQISNVSRNIMKFKYPSIKIVTGLYQILLSLQPMYILDAKLIMSLWMMACFVISRVYQSNLNAMITAPKLMLPFNDLDQMMSQDVLSYYAVKDSVMHNFLLNAPPESRFHKMNKNLAGTIPNPISQIIAGEIAFITLDMFLESLVHVFFKEGYECKVTTMKERFYMQTMGFAVQKNSQIKKKMDKIITRMVEAGILDRIAASYLSLSKNCSPIHPGLSKAKLASLAVSNLHGTFLLYASGMILATISFAAEIFFEKDLVNFLGY